MKSRILMCIAAITFFVALAVPVPLGAQQTTSGTNGRIVFNQGDPNVPTNIFTANPDGADIKQVPLGDQVELFSNATWSPDGTKLLIGHTIRFDSAGQCCLPFRPATVNPDGSDYTLLTIPNGPIDMDCGVWSLDQSRLLCSFGDLNGGVFSVRASDGGDPVRLTTNPFSANGGADFPTDISLDGTHFLFLRYKTKPNPRDPTPDAQVALFVENTDGTGLLQLTAMGLVRPASLTTTAHWSPDGTRIIGEIGNGKMFTIRPDGTHFTSVNLPVTSPYFAFGPTWSPDGTRIIFGMFINGGEGLYTANPDGSGLVEVAFTTNFATLFNGPDWGTHPVTP